MEFYDFTLYGSDISHPKISLFFFLLLARNEIYSNT
jgi:hypothetical protein